MSQKVTSVMSGDAWGRDGWGGVESRGCQGWPGADDEGPETWGYVRQQRNTPECRISWYSRRSRGHPVVLAVTGGGGHIHGQRVRGLRGGSGNLSTWGRSRKGWSRWRLGGWIRGRRWDSRSRRQRWRRRCKSSRSTSVSWIPCPFRSRPGGSPLR